MCNVCERQVEREARRLKAEARTVKLIGGAIDAVRARTDITYAKALVEAGLADYLPMDVVRMVVHNRTGALVPVLYDHRPRRRTIFTDAWYDVRLALSDAREAFAGWFMRGYDG